MIEKEKVIREEEPEVLFDSIELNYIKHYLIVKRNCYLKIEQAEGLTSVYSSDLAFVENLIDKCDKMIEQKRNRGR